MTGAHLVGRNAPLSSRRSEWLGLCPDNRITGGKVIRRGTRHVSNRSISSKRRPPSSDFSSSNRWPPT